MQLGLVTAVSAVAYTATRRAIPGAMATLRERGIYGIDINKTTAAQRKAFGDAKRSAAGLSAAQQKMAVPESLGIVVGAFNLCAVTVLVLLAGLPTGKANAALTASAFGLLLGFVDDVLDVKWRHKILLSVFSTLPLIASYDGSLDVLVPLPLQAATGVATVHLGPLYLVYMALVCIFCTNTINILAGVNGVEVGQSVVIALAQMLHNWVQMRTTDGTVSAGDAEGHALSFVILAPFVACSLALWHFNRYPSQVFIGDSYTYFAGMTLAVAGISGGYSKTLLLFFIPQIFNFVVSIPQLFHIVECPRHRVPKWNPATDKLENSRNLTILNAILAVAGPLHERTLTQVLLAIQVVCCAFAFWVRYALAGKVFDVVR
jgi:UDP-N-acetylglucosamine--dolichyl-phosphate N-acetylglucosaminephosphotransferase